MSEPTGPFVITTCRGPQEPELASLPFVVGNGVLALETPCTIILQASATLLAVRGGADHTFARELPPLKTLIALFLEHGGKLLVSLPGMQSRKIATGELLEGVEIIAVTRLALECLEARAVLSY